MKRVSTILLNSERGSNTRYNFTRLYNYHMSTPAFAATNSKVESGCTPVTLRATKSAFFIICDLVQHPSLYTPSVRKQVRECCCTCNITCTCSVVARTCNIASCGFINRKSCMRRCNKCPTLKTVHMFLHSQVR